MHIAGAQLPGPKVAGARRPFFCRTSGGTSQTG
jgi:hypothetical protein